MQFGKRHLFTVHFLLGLLLDLEDGSDILL
jgi:hypothetical protein